MARQLIEPAVSPATIVRERVFRWPTGVVMALVVLRLCTGWHFYREGTKKLAYDPRTGVVRLDFSAEGFLRQAVGPLAPLAKLDLPNFHNWEGLLAVPRQSTPETSETAAAEAAWAAAYAVRRKEAEQKNEPTLVEFPPKAAYHDWADKVVADWQTTVHDFSANPQITEAQRTAASAALARRQQELADYLDDESKAIAEWQHQLWRLHEWETAPGAKQVPFEAARIAQKRTETTVASAAWIEQVRAIERELIADLRDSLTDDQRANAKLVAEVDGAIADAKDHELLRVNVAVTCLVIGVGVCLMLGLFTRLAAVCGIAFLVMVIATQPPWVDGAITTVFYYQLVESAALLVLLASAAGRWAGLDFFLHAAFSRRYRRDL